MTDLGFQFRTVGAVLCEDGAASRLGDILAARFDRAPVLVVTDPGIIKLGLAGAAIASLEAAGFAPAVFDAVTADPADHVVLAATEAATRHGAGIIVGFGGGSSMDVAKLVAVLAKGREPLSDIYGLDKIKSGRLPLVQVPTTAGTGSEVTSVAIVTTGETTKAGVGSPVLLADLALLDATLTTGLPRHVTAATGIDAMVHAIEAFTSRIKKNPVSDAFARQALKMLGGNLLKACGNEVSLDARRAMLTGAMLAGTAFANAPVAAVHALAYPVGGIFHVPHGLSNALVLPHVMRFNLPAAFEFYGELAADLGLAGDTTPARAEALIAWLEGLIEATGIERRLREVGVAENDVERLAEDAMLQTRLLVNNPREVTLSDARAIYEATW
ncbi:iron-containing alcohol dehydrogenase [Gimibacter soli]|uniref:Alcohol dehydrogenase 2 n=1 Tax=Gimibacter soli TaxID=3024400 RepID=A0AAE9XKK5_9PROT|nr:iron-containing alcohol dehydrogenase [Gimibacter soli]WCL52647.1 iron-containing alcohol dehydrogenase [Gimibacter soli]